MKMYKTWHTRCKHTNQRLSIFMKIAFSPSAPSGSVLLKNKTFCYRDYGPIIITTPTQFTKYWYRIIPFDCKKIHFLLLYRTTSLNYFYQFYLYTQCPHRRGFIRLDGAKCPTYDVTNHKNKKKLQTPEIRLYIWGTVSVCQERLSPS